MNSAETAQRKVDAPGWDLPTDAAAFDPLLESLLLLGKIYERPASANMLRSGLPLEQDRLTPRLFARAARRIGLSARVVKRRLDKISNMICPAVLLLENASALVLLGSTPDDKGFRVIQPETGEGEAVIAKADLQPLYSGYAIFVQPKHRYDERAPEIHELRSRHWFWGTIFQSWRIYRDVLVASFLINLFALASPLFIMNVYDRVVPNQAIETLWVLASGILLVFGFDFILKSLRGYFIDTAGKKADVQLSARMFEQVLGLKLSSRPASVGAFANNLREFESIRDFITSATVTTLVDLPFVVLFVAITWIIGGPLALIPLVGIPIIVVFGLAVQGPLRKAVEQTFRASAQKNATLVESLTGIEAVKCLGAEHRLQNKWEQMAGHIARWSARSRLLSAFAVNLAGFVQQFASVAVVVLGVYLITAGELSMGALIAAVILTGRAMAPMGQVANLSTRYYQARTALHSLNQIMALPVDRPAGKAFLSRPVLEGGIEFDDVNFTYPGQDLPVLLGVSFRIHPGEKVAIIGRVGSGKTTVEKLLQGLYEPTAGAVRIDGTDVRQIDPADLRSNIGYVPQDVMLFYGSVRENIILGAPYCEDEAVLRAAELAGVTEYVNRHPLGFDLQVGERGEQLSGGQRQTVAIARALLLDPPVYLLDEPTNSMDNSTEESIKQSLSAVFENKTVLLITHRASLLDLVDRIIVLEAGRIAADGPKAQVLEALRQGKLRTLRR